MAGTGRELAADLVVDASGRQSRAPEWLRAAGVEPPAETVVDSLCGYSTRWFKAPEPERWPSEWWWKGIWIDPLLPAQRTAGVLFPVEGGRWIVTLAGIGGHRPLHGRDLHLSGQLGVDARAALLEVQEPAHREHGVAEPFAFETAAVHAPYEAVLGIDLRRVGTPLAGLAVSRRGDHELVDGLEAPAAGHEIAREPIEQLGMRGRVADDAEIAGRGDDAAAEMVLPEPIDDDACRQGMIGAGEPCGQLGAAAGGGAGAA